MAIDYAALRKKFPGKNPEKSGKAAKIKAIAREYERKKAELGGLKAPVLKKGIVFYAVIAIGLILLGSLVLSATGRGGKAYVSRALVDARKSVDALATALGRYRYHVGNYPSTKEGLAALAAKYSPKPGWNGPYVKKIVDDPWGEAYVYVCNGEAQDPTLYSKGPDGLAGTPDDVIADSALFDAPFADVSWTEGWMPAALRGYVLVPDEAAKKKVEAEVKSIIDAAASPFGSHWLRDGWEFAQAWRETVPLATNAVSQSRETDASDPSLVWKPVRVPHDWAIDAAFDPGVTNGATAKLPWRGVGFYRRNIEVPASAKGAFVALRFKGVMASPEVFLNGEKAGGWDYGYMGFEVDLSDKIRFGEKNELVVRADTTRHNSRWYPGAGIYRDVALVVQDAEKRILEGSLAITVKELTERRALVEFEYDTPAGHVVERENVDEPVLWSTARPHLYEKEIFGVKYRYGIRTAEFTADDGFHLNGERLQLKGVNLHSDLGLLGMAYDSVAMRRILAAMKDIGVNAIRTSHNPPDPDLLDLCDEMGFVVWDECFDKWDGSAGISKVEELDEYVSRNLKAFVRRDRNHPCVICWSLGNEMHSVGRQKDPFGVSAERCEKFREVILEEDKTRPVGMGFCFSDMIETGEPAPLDLTGWNYKGQYAGMKAKYPGKPVVYSESASAFSSWGFYDVPLLRRPDLYEPRPEGTDFNWLWNTVKEVDSFDRTAAAWADIPDQDFARMERDRYCAGEFVWSGVDYLGEPAPGATLCRSSFFGICDLLVLPKDRYWLYRSYWNDRATTVHLLPHWNWEGREGEKIPVACYTSGDEAELFLNGESLGRAKKNPSAPLVEDASKPEYYDVTARYRLVWEVPYEPGELRVVAYKNSLAIGEDVRKTAYSAKALRLVAEQDAIRDGEPGFIRIEAVDEFGTPAPFANDTVSLRLEGPGELEAAGNSLAYACESLFKPSSVALSYGRALAIVRRGSGSGKPLRLVATAPGLRSAAVVLPRKP